MSLCPQVAAIAVSVPVAGRWRRTERRRFDIGSNRRTGSGRDVLLDAHGDSLKIDAPRGAVTSELLKALREQKPRLIRFLQPPEPVTDDGRCTVHGRYLTFAETLHGACSWCEADPIALASWGGIRKGKRPGERGPYAA